jgi:fatty-acyl-CoA synthase
VKLVDLYFATGKTGSLRAPLLYRLAEQELAAVVDDDVDPAVVVVETPFEADLIDALEQSDDEPADDDHRHDPLAADADDAGCLEAVEAALADPHLLLHTSGSTGTPKETVHDHGAIHLNAYNTVTSWGLRPDDVTPIAFPMFGTGGWNVLLLPFFQLGATVLLRREVSPGDASDRRRAGGDDDARGDAGDVGAMARHDDWAGADLSSLRFVRAGAGPAGGDRRCVARARRRRLAVLRAHRVRPEQLRDARRPLPGKGDTVGVPGLFVDDRLVDEDGDPVDRGELGELELTGHAAAVGYLGSPEADTFGEWVSTGPLARIHVDGYVQVEGRTDAMFVSDGENVYPRQVEAAIVDHPAVEDAVVYGVPDERLETVPEAVVVATRSLTASDLAAFLDARVAEHAVPTTLEVAEELPRESLTSVDRAAVERRFRGRRGTEPW